MQNRRERRLMEKQMGLRKLEKTMPKEELAKIKERKKEFVKQQVLQRAQDEENRRINEEAERWSKSLAHMMEMGISREEAEAVLEKEKQRNDERKARIAAKRSLKK